MNSERIHVALIPDGNRRWAKKYALVPWKGHEQSAKTFADLVEAAAKGGQVSVLTLWAFSTENWKRDPQEIDALMDILEKQILDQRYSLIKNHIHLIRSGRSDRVPKRLLDVIDRIGEETKVDPRMELHIALDYGGQDEITRAIQKLPDPAHATPEMIQKYLDHPELPPIDLVIRTSGEQRTSNFFLWQSTYAEWMFVDKLFPDFGPVDLQNAIADFRDRQRRFGA